MASHNYKLYLYFIIARASRALSNIASDYAVNKLRKYDFLPGQSGCPPLPSPSASPELPLCFLSYLPSSSFAFSSLPHPVASAVGHVRIMLVMAALPSPLACPIVVVLPVGGGACQGACAGIYWRWAAAAPSAAAAALGLSCLRCCRACLRVF